VDGLALDVPTGDSAFDSQCSCPFLWGAMHCAPRFV
jgi:hypothetical protein